MKKFYTLGAWSHSLALFVIYFYIYTQAIVAINADQGCSAKGYYYKIIREDMYKKCCDFLEVHFLPDEPVCKGIGIPWSDEVEAIFMSVLTQHLSIAILSSTTNDIVGIRMIGIASSGPGVDPDDFGEEPVRKYFRFIRYKTGVADAFKVPQHTLANFTTYCPSYSRQTSCRF